MKGQTHSEVGPNNTHTVRYYYFWGEDIKQPMKRAAAAAKERTWMWGKKGREGGRKGCCRTL